MTMHTTLGGDRAPQGGEWPQQLQDLHFAAADVYGLIARGEQLSPSVNAFIDQDHAVIRRGEPRPTRYAETHLSQNPDTGIWSVAVVHQRPSNEYEGYGGTVREVQTIPIHPGARMSFSSILGRLTSAGQFMPERDLGGSDMPVEDVTYNSLSIDFAELLGKNRQPRSFSVRGWLRSLFAER
jgi:hypothetical protein